MIEDPVFECARSGDVEGLRSTVNNSNLDAKDEKGYSPLMLTAYNGHFEASEFLLRLAADPDSRDNSGNSVLMGATYRGNLKVVKLLLRFGADPFSLNDQKQNALEFARLFGRKEVEKILDIEQFSFGNK